MSRRELLFTGDGDSCESAQNEARTNNTRSRGDFKWHAQKYQGSELSFKTLSESIFQLHGWLALTGSAGQLRRGRTGLFVKVCFGNQNQADDPLNESLHLSEEKIDSIIWMSSIHHI